MKLDIFNEITTVALVDFLTVFSAANLTKFDSEADIVFLVCLFVNLAVHLFFLIKTTVVKTKESCKKCKNKFNPVKRSKKKNKKIAKNKIADEVFPELRPRIDKGS